MSDQEQQDPGAGFGELVNAYSQAAQAAGTPQMISVGRYALFAAPEGGLVLAFRPDGVEEDQHIEIPAMAVRMMASGGGPFKQMAAAFGLG